MVNLLPEIGVDIRISQEIVEHDGKDGCGGVRTCDHGKRSIGHDARERRRHVFNTVFVVLSNEGLAQRHITRNCACVPGSGTDP